MNDKEMSEAAAVLVAAGWRAEVLSEFTTTRGEYTEAKLTTPDGRIFEAQGDGPYYANENLRELVKSSGYNEYLVFPTVELREKKGEWQAQVLFLQSLEIAEMVKKIVGG